MSERDTPSSAKTIAELEDMTRKELVKQHDFLARDGRGTVVDIAYYLDELSRRTLEQQGKRMERLTWAIFGLTLVNVLILILNG